MLSHYELAHKVGQALLTHGLQLATAESCTAGGLGYAITEVPGSSNWYAGGVVSYTYASKQTLLDVPFALLEQHTAVSQEVAVAMAKGIQQRLQTEISIAITGIAGPDGGTPQIPVGTVWLAWCLGQHNFSEQCNFEGNREVIRQAAIARALVILSGLKF